MAGIANLWRGFSGNRAKEEIKREEEETDEESQQVGSEDMEDDDAEDDDEQSELVSEARTRSSFDELDEDIFAPKSDEDEDERVYPKRKRGRPRTVRTDVDSEDEEEPQASDTDSETVATRSSGRRGRGRPRYENTRAKPTSSHKRSAPSSTRMTRNKRARAHDSSAPNDKRAPVVAGKRLTDALGVDMNGVATFANGPSSTRTKRRGEVKNGSTSNDDDHLLHSRAESSDEQASSPDDTVASRLRTRRGGGGGGLAATLENVDDSHSSPLAARIADVDDATVTARDWNLDLSEIDLSSRVHLSKGAVSDVWKVKWVGTSAVLKVWHPNSQDERFKNEVAITRMCQYPRVVQLYGASLEHRSMLMERIGRGNLRNVLTSEKYTLGSIDRRIRTWAVEVAEALQFVHSNDVIHYDVKSQNVLVDMSWHVRLCDFSHSLYVKGGAAKAWGQVGSLEVTAPEVFLKRERTKASDVYSYGILLWEMLAYGEAPFMQYSTDSVALKMFVTPPINGRPQLKAAWPPEWKALIRKCWAIRTTDRGTFGDVLAALALMPDLGRGK